MATAVPTATSVAATATIAATADGALGPGAARSIGGAVAEAAMAPACGLAACPKWGDHHKKLQTMAYTCTKCKLRIRNAFPPQMFSGSLAGCLK